MINTEKFFSDLKSCEIDFFTGVPDSLLSNLCACIEEKTSPTHHVIAANEGNAIAIAAGYHLGSKKIAAVYMQNSGLGNAINPLASLTDPEVYKIPMLLIIGWRGEPHTKDEPQHIKQGRITEGQLNLLEIPYVILDSKSNASLEIKKCVEKIHKTSAPVAILVRKDTFTKYVSKLTNEKNEFTLSREQALQEIIAKVGDSVIISTTGKASREIYEIRKKKNKIQNDFLSVGCMGHVSSIALGLSIENSKKNIFCIDGDGSVIMHMGALAILGSQKELNITHIILNNASHESVGGQPTVADKINIGLIAEACNYSNYQKALNIEEIKNALELFDGIRGVKMLEIVINKKSRENLGRPDSTPEENKKNFMTKVLSLS